MGMDISRWKSQVFWARRWNWKVENAVACPGADTLRRERICSKEACILELIGVYTATETSLYSTSLATEKA